MMNAVRRGWSCGCFFLTTTFTCLSQAPSPGVSSPSSDVILVPNGDFEQADPADASKPLHWDKPDGLGVQWRDAPQIAGQPSHGKAIRIDTSVSEEDMTRQWTKMGISQWSIPKPARNPVAETYGLSFYSDAIAIMPGQAYRITFDFLSSAPAGKVWVRAFGQVDGQKRRLYETIVNCTRPSTSLSAAPSSAGGPVAAGRKEWNGHGWSEFSQIFHPTKHRPTVTEMKIMLYAYHPPGVCWFDNVRIVQAETPQK